MVFSNIISIAWQKQLNLNCGMLISFIFIEMTIITKMLDATKVFGIHFSRILNFNIDEKPFVLLLLINMHIINCI